MIRKKQVAMKQMRKLCLFTLIACETLGDNEKRASVKCDNDCMRLK